jgi:hypothetical protein
MAIGEEQKRDRSHTFRVLVLIYVMEEEEEVAPKDSPPAHIELVLEVVACLETRQRQLAEQEVQDDC